MANTDAPIGFRYLRNAGGGTPLIKEFIVESGRSVATFKNDLATGAAGGSIISSAANDGIKVVGVVEGLLDSNRKPVLTLASSVAGYALVNVTPDAIYEVQADSGTTLTVAAIMATANHSAGSGSSTTGLSGHELDASDVGTGLQLRIIDLVRKPSNAWGEHVKLEVMLNECVNKAGTATI